MIEPEVIEKLQWLASTSRRELTGFISTDNKIYPVINIGKDPDCFLMERRSYAKALNKIHSEGQAVAALYHTHYGQNVEPSEKDLKVFRTLNFNTWIIITSSSYKVLQK